MKINRNELHNIFNNLKLDKEKSFNELYVKYNKLIYCIAFSILKNKENSEDIVQIVFTKIYSLDLGKLPNENEASWLYAITKNEALNYVRKQKNNISLEDIDFIEYEDSELERVIDKDVFNRIMKKLGETEREIVSLKILANMKFKDIAKLLNMPIGTVQWKYYTSVHCLKLILSNLSMFIIGVMIFITNRELKKGISNSSDMSMSNSEIENKDSETNMNDGIIIDSSVSNSDTSIEIKPNENNTDKIDNELIDDIIENNEIINNNVLLNEIENTIDYNFEEHTIQNIENENLNKIDLGIIVFSTLFLLLTIIFSIIYLKHQQKSKKNVSK